MIKSNLKKPQTKIGPKSAFGARRFHWVNPEIEKMFNFELESGRRAVETAEGFWVKSCLRQHS